MEEKITLNGFEILGRFLTAWPELSDIEKAYLVGRAEAKAEDAKRSQR